MSTQVELAVKGIVTPVMKEIASQEGVEPETVRLRIAEGQIVAPLNANRLGRIVGIGMGLRSKVNASIGTSTDIVDVGAEVIKARAAESAGGRLCNRRRAGGDSCGARKVPYDRGRRSCRWPGCKIARGSNAIRSADPCRSVGPASLSLEAVSRSR